MPDLHAWLTAQVDHVETIARGHGQWSLDWYYDDHAGEIRDRLNRGTVAFVPAPGDALHIELHNPADVLRRCAADRRILERHRADPDETDPLDAHACQACSYTNRAHSIGIKSTVDLADCPELLDLAHAHGITDDILASLDRPQRPEIKPWEYRPRTHAADVPPGLRGPNWKGQP
ncbi:DUF6221 family protein [Streptomyces sp. NPDC059928]|uniref:DUF6221 family protein n=1 Tax=unclassified Streptomyces TaxID=2593676 RepID=UPI003654E277